MKKKVIYYSDELNDDFTKTTGIEKKDLPENFKYIHANPFYKFFEFFLYHVIARPFAFLCVKLVFLQKFQNKKILKEAKKTGAYFYINHTHGLLDAYLPNILTPPKKNYIVVGREAFSIKGIGTIVGMLGGIPLGDTLKHKSDYFRCIERHINEHKTITIYPEAHIWDFYNKIRPYREHSFIFPIKYNAPVYAITNCYQKRKIGNFPKVVTYINGPFYPDNSLSEKEKLLDLRNKVYNTMKENSERYSTYEYIKYIKI